MPQNYIKWIRECVGHDPILLIASIAIIQGPDGKILAIRRGDTGSKVHWGFPGGMMEIGESAEDAMKREVREELGITVRVKYAQGAYTNRGMQVFPSGDQAQVVLFVFVCEKEAVEQAEVVDGGETAEFEYLLPTEAASRMPHHAQVLADYQAGVRGIVR